MGLEIWQVPPEDMTDWRQGSLVKCMCCLLLRCFQGKNERFQRHVVTMDSHYDDVELVVTVPINQCQVLCGRGNEANEYDLLGLNHLYGVLVDALQDEAKNGRRDNV